MSQTAPAASPQERLASLVRGYTPLQLAIAGLLAVAVIIGSLMLFRAVTTPAMGVLFSNLSAQDAATITATLTGDGVAYQLEAGGTTITVPADQVDQLRLQMAGQGLPKQSTVGYEILDGQSLTTSSFREQVNYQRALEGELDRTLMTMDGVDAASVRLVMPEERLFSNDNRPASAAVQLTTTQQLTDDQVQAIVHLVASSVPDLNPSNVTLTDATGKLLAGGDTTGTAATAGKAESAIEAQLTASAETMLSSVLGPDMAVVRVAADVSRDDQTQQSEIYDPTKQAVGTQTTGNETYTSSSTDNTGGVVTTQPQTTTQAQTGKQENTQYSNQTSAQENLVSRTITETKTPPGTISRLTVAVAVSDKVKATTAQIQQLVANAVGLDTNRGDTIVVTSMPFTEPAATEAPATIEVSPVTSQLPTILGALLLVGISVFLLLRMRRRREPLGDDELAAAGLLAAQAQSPENNRPPKSTADRLLDKIDENPQETGNVLRGWLAEDQTKNR